MNALNTLKYTDLQSAARLSEAVGLPVNAPFPLAEGVRYLSDMLVTATQYRYLGISQEDIEAGLDEAMREIVRDLQVEVVQAAIKAGTRFARLAPSEDV